MDFTQVGSGNSMVANTVALALAPRSKATGAADGMASLSPDASTATASTGSNITSADFLTLLVSELKNQDPTQPTDPNAYVQQLVGVNSLQQLIQINQGLTGLETKPPAAAAVSATASS